MDDNDHKLVRSVTKIYPHSTVVMVFHLPFKITLGAKEKRPFPIIAALKDKRAERHAKTTVKDIVLCTPFEHFTTFTFDPKKFRNRYDMGMCKMVMQRWLELQRKKYGRFKYLIVPEYHKDGAIHFHALFAQYNGPLSDSGVKHDSRPVFNIPAWQYGFSTAKVIDQNPDSLEKVASYVSKYITKDMPTFPGKKRFWASKELPRPVHIVNQFSRDQDILCDTNHIQYSNEYITSYRIPSAEISRKNSPTPTDCARP